MVFLEKVREIGDDVRREFLYDISHYSAIGGLLASRQSGDPKKSLNC